MAKTQMTFDKAAPYERYMGRWSRAVGDIFLAWLAPPKSASWLDVGCGTGAFTELVRDNCSPAPAAAQIEHPQRKPIAQRAVFCVADALALPFPDDRRAPTAASPIRRAPMPSRGGCRRVELQSPIGRPP